MFRKLSLVCVAVLVAQLANAQHKGTLTQESTLSLPYETCTSSGCQEQKGGVTMDGNWRWTHKASLVIFYLAVICRESSFGIFLKF